MTTLGKKIFQTFESFLRVPPLLLIDEILRHSFGLGVSRFAGPASAATPYDEDGGTELPSHSSKPVGSWYIAFFTQSWIWKALVSCLPAMNLPGQNDSSGELLDHTDFASSEYLLHISLGGTEWNVIHDVFSNDLLRSVEVLACLILFTMMVIVFVLSTENLITLYVQYISWIVLYITYILNPLPISSWLVLTEVSFWYNVVIRLAMCVVYLLSTSWTNSRNRDQNEPESKVLKYMIVPIFFVTGVVHLSPTIYILVLVLETNFRENMFMLYNFLRVSWDETKRIRHEFGLNHLIHVQSGRLRLNTVFRLFWITKASYDALHQCCDSPPDEVIKYIMTRGTETLTGVVGITAVISCIANQFGEFILWILYYGANSESDANRFGSISTVLFFILSLQTGLTTLDPEKRLDRLTKNFILLATALLHALHQMVSPILHAYRSLQALQIRAVLLSLTFLGICAFATAWLLRSCPISTWSLAVLALAIEFKIKVVVSLIIAGVLYMSQLIVYPAPLRRAGHYARLALPQSVVRFSSYICDEISHEDLVFYLKTFANVAEFLTGIFLFANAIWIFLFESASAIRAIGMSIHAYFNIWCEAKKGWRIYCQRRTAAVKITSLKDATDAQLLEKKDDVCAICYEEMENAKVTFCGHLFHAVCLRKWLYLQNTCPLCHEVLYSENLLTADQQQQEHEQADEAGERRHAPRYRPRLVNRRFNFLNARQPQPEPASDLEDSDAENGDAHEHMDNQEIPNNEGLVVLI